jgi:hypothetical protein
LVRIIEDLSREDQVLYLLFQVTVIELPRVGVSSIAIAK